MRHSTYLERRIEHLAQLARSGKLRFPARPDPESSIEQVLADLDQVRFRPDGRVDLRTCTPLVRSLARSLYSLRSELDQELPAIDRDPEPVGDPVVTQRKLFEVLDALVRELSGRSPTAIASVEDFTELVKRRFRAVRASQLETLTVELLNAYRDHARVAFTAAKRLGGLKLVMGGSQRFPQPAFDAIRSMLLYADTVLIPDPVFPWIEVERNEEAFRHVHLHREAFSLVRLKPLVDADLPYPAVLVFPSFEKSLERDDVRTQDGIARLWLDFFSYHFRHRFDDETEILDFAGEHAEQFLTTVERERLFVAPGGEVGDELTIAVARYRDEIARWRSEDHQKIQLGYSDQVLVMNGIMERLIPQFHLRDNASSLRAQPMLWHAAHWHYFSLCSQLGESVSSSNEARQVLRALGERELQWLGNIPLESLVELRLRNENERFRKRLGHFTSVLSNAAVEELDRAVSEVGRGLASLLSEHQEEIRGIQERYAQKHKRTAVASWLTAAAKFLPWLAPHFTPVLPGAVTVAYLFDKAAERRELRAASQSLTGVLAAAYAKR